jgi:hypothetical protein
MIEHPSGNKCNEIAEYMGFNLGTAFTALWDGELEKARLHLQRAYEQRAPWPQVMGHSFREIMADRRHIFNRPSPWCESVRYALAAICDACTNPQVVESERLIARAIQCVETAIADENCVGRGQEP